MAAAKRVIIRSPTSFIELSRQEGHEDTKKENKYFRGISEVEYNKKTVTVLSKAEIFQRELEKITTKAESMQDEM